MPHIKPNKTIATIIAILLIILSILLTRPEIITKLPYNAIAIYKHYKIQYEIQKELKKQSEEYIKQHEERYQKMLEAHQKFEQEQKEREKLLSNDHYGGKTPEETLALFVGALKKKDYKLAAKYYVPWKWEEKEKTMYRVVNNEKNRTNIIKAYEYGKFSQREGVVFLYLYMQRPDEKYPYRLKMIFNDKTGV